MEGNTSIDNVQLTVLDSPLCQDCLIIAGLVVGTTEGGSGDAITVPVEVRNAPNTTDALGVDVHFDATTLQFTGCNFTGTLLQEWDFKDCELQPGGIIRVGGFTTRNAIPAGANGLIVQLNFTVLVCQEEGAEAALPPENLVDDIATWQTCVGCYTCVLCGDGDVDGSGQVTPGDALIVFECFLGRRVCTPEQVRRGDINRDGGLTPADALCIFRQFLGRPPEPECICFLP